MQIQIELEATARLDIDMDETMVIDVMQNYNGDFEAWAKNNYHDFMDFNDFDVDFDDCYYNEDEAKKLILKSKEVLGLDDDFNIDRVISHRTTLRRFAGDTPTVEDNLEELKIDIDLVAKAINYAAFDNPKWELNYIHLDKNTISATDAHKLIHITNHKYTHFDNDFFPPCFIEPLQNGAELFKNIDGYICMKYKSQWFISDLSEKWKDSKFPEVERILLSKDGYKGKAHIPFKKFSSNSITQKYQAKDFPKELIKFKANDRAVYIKEICYNEVINLHEDLEDVYTLKSTPVHFIGKNMQVVVMPVILDEEDEKCK